MKEKREERKKRIVQKLLSVIPVVALAGVVALSVTAESASPSYTLTYYGRGSMLWDNSVGYDDESGAAIFSIYDFQYDNVLSDNGDLIIAPGTGSTLPIRLANASDHPVAYTSVFYLLQTTDIIPMEVDVQANMSGDGVMNPLPPGVTAEDVLRTATGVLQSGEAHDFSISWAWQFYSSDEQDIIDTMLGNSAAEGDDLQVYVGMYTIIEEGNDEDVNTPGPGSSGIAQTGDAFHVVTYLVLMAASVAALLMLLANHRKEKQ